MPNGDARLGCRKIESWRPLYVSLDPPSLGATASVTIYWVEEDPGLSQAMWRSPFRVPSMTPRAIRRRAGG